MCSTSRGPLKTSKIDRIKQSPWRPATLSKINKTILFIVVVILLAKLKEGY